jgi:uncharacterized protein (UPF0297 family)
MKYEKDVIETAYKLGYNATQAISEYTQLEIKYSKNPFNISDEVRKKARDEIIDKMLVQYRQLNKD